VKVLEVDEKRKRIALTMRLEDQASRPREAGQPPYKPESRSAARVPRAQAQTLAGGAMADAFANAFKGKR
jgi:uncharacterized protein